MSNLPKRKPSPSTWLLLLLSGLASAAPPTGYYDTAEGLNGTALKSALHDIIDNHTVISYSQTDEVMRVIDEDPNNTSNVGLIYSTFSMNKNSLGSSGSTVWNREHLWPRSYGIESSGPDNSDLHNLFPCNAAVNASRGNKYFDETDETGSTNSVSPENTFDDNSWEPSDADKGIVARAGFYIAVRYDGSDPSTFDVELSDSPSTASRLMGNLTTLLAWNRNFPPSTSERARNDSLFAGVQTTAGFLKQGNRNPFIDHHEFADAVFLPNDVLTWNKWLVQSFTIAELDDQLVTGPLADPDQDGNVNLVEFVANSNPSSAESTPFRTVEQDGANIALRFRKIKNLSLSGYQCTWERSLDLKIWEEITPTSITETDEGSAAVEVLTFPTDNQMTYWRMKVESLE